MNELNIFENKEFGNIRELEIDGEPWFVGKDIAVALGYNDTDQALRKHVDSEDKLTRQFNGSGQKRSMAIINESGLYSLIFGSKLESAKRFKHWVTSEVLPSIRKSGTYGSNGVDRVSEEFMKRQMETSRMQAVILENVIDRLEALESQKNCISFGNPFSARGEVINQRMRTLNDLTDQVADLCELERNKVLHYLYKTLQEDMGVSLNPYLVVMRSESGNESICNLHVIASIDRFYEKAVEMNQDVIERKKIYG